jgi:hypothetical protein
VCMTDRRSSPRTLRPPVRSLSQRSVRNAPQSPPFTTLIVFSSTYGRAYKSQSEVDTGGRECTSQRVGKNRRCQCMSQQTFAGSVGFTHTLRGIFCTPRCPPLTRTQVPVTLRLYKTATTGHLCANKGYARRARPGSSVLSAHRNPIYR